MAGTRSSTRQATAASSSPSSKGSNASTTAAAGSKRKVEAGADSKSKRGKKGAQKEQKTLEETMLGEGGTRPSEDVEMEGADGGDAEKSIEETKTEDTPNTAETAYGKGDGLKEREDALKAREDAVKEKENAQEAFSDSKKDGMGVEEDDAQEISADNKETGEDVSKMDDTGEVKAKATEKSAGVTSDTNGGAVKESSEREKSTPSSILEKGVIYFFFRGRVGIDDPQGVEDLARSYIVLRPLTHGASLGDGVIDDAGNYRLLSLPKKVLPKSHHDRFMIFVDKVKTTAKDIKENFIISSDYATKTAGVRHTPTATPVGEGIYAITTTGRESHLAYILTTPSELSEVQEDIGLRKRGSYVTSVKNPQYPGPANTNLPEGPGYPQEILDEFRSLRWMPLQPKLLDYENTQILLIGEGMDEIGRAAEQTSKDERDDKDTPLEEMEKLEHEDELRVKHLKGDDPVFEDLGLSSKEYSKMQTSW
ncbi:MAG: hypothetical protein M1827_001690 [Pycnora praestabilis]|nr:MAG: hypothetical protein M1827_001690 [Pycnora praestabilis]